MLGAIGNATERPSVAADSGRPYEKDCVFPFQFSLPLLRLLLPPFCVMVSQIEKVISLSQIYNQRAWLWRLDKGFRARAASRDKKIRYRLNICSRLQLELIYKSSVVRNLTLLETLQTSNSKMSSPMGFSSFLVAAVLQLHYFVSATGVLISANSLRRQVFVSNTTSEL